VFSDAKGGQEQFAKRGLWRLSSKGVSLNPSIIFGLTGSVEGIPLHLRHLVDVRFVMGRSGNDTMEKELDAEHALYGDLFRLDGLEHGENSTHYFLPY
jgi:hypothetical protein